MTRRARAAAASAMAPPADRGALGVRVWLRLLASASIITEHLRRNLRDEFDVTLPVFDLMAQTHREPRGPTMSELSRRLMVTKGNVSELVERLEEDGLVERRADERDGRVQHVHLTARGEELAERMLPAHRAWLAELTAGVDEEVLARLHDLLGTFKAALPRAEARARAPSTAGSQAPRETAAAGPAKRRGGSRRAARSPRRRGPGRRRDPRDGGPRR